MKIVKVPVLLQKVSDVDVPLAELGFDGDMEEFIDDCYLDLEKVVCFHEFEDGSTKVVFSDVNFLIVEMDVETFRGLF